MLHIDGGLTHIFQLAYAKSQIEWAKKNKETWEDARLEVNKIDES